MRGAVWFLDDAVWICQLRHPGKTTGARNGGRRRLADLAGRKFNTIAVLFEPLPPVGLLPLLRQFAESGGKVIWSGPPAYTDMAGASTFGEWKELLGVERLLAARDGLDASGRRVEFSGRLGSVPPQIILTSFRVDLIHPVQAKTDIEVVARCGDQAVGMIGIIAAAGRRLILHFALAMIRRSRSGTRPAPGSRFCERNRELSRDTHRRRDVR